MLFEFDVVELWWSLTFLLVVDVVSARQSELSTQDLLCHPIQSLQVKSSFSRYLLCYLMMDALQDYWVRAVAFYHRPELGSVLWPAGGVVFYFAVLLVLKWWMQDKPRGYYDNALRPYLVAHNLFLSFLSLVMVIAFVKNGLNIARNSGLYTLYCGYEDAPERDIEMGWWAYIFYLTKYYEFLDTFFLVLKKSELTFLHVFHHSSVVLVCWFALTEEIFMGWITCINNAGDYSYSLPYPLPVVGHIF